MILVKYIIIIIYAICFLCQNLNASLGFPLGRYLTVKKKKDSEDFITEGPGFTVCSQNVRFESRCILVAK